MEETNIEKIKKALKKGKLSKTEIIRKTKIHNYLINSYLNALEKNKIIKKSTNDSGKFIYYQLIKSKTKKEVNKN